MPTVTLAEFISSVVNINDNPLYATWPAERKVLYVVNQVSGALLRYIDILATESTVDDAEVTAGLEAVFDKYLVPIKMSNNAFIERLIEGQIRAQIPALTAMFANFVQQRQAS